MRIEYATEIRVYADWQGKPQEARSFSDTKRSEPCCESFREDGQEYLKFSEDTDKPALTVQSRGYDDTYYVPIAFCPWCGTKFEYVEVKRTRRVERKVERTFTQTQTVYDETEETPGV